MTASHEFAPALTRDRGYLAYDDGCVHGELMESPDGALEIWDWFSAEQGKGHTVRALKWLVNEAGYARIVVIDATDEAMPYWQKMLERGLVHEVHAEGESRKPSPSMS